MCDKSSGNKRTTDRKEVGCRQDFWSVFGSWDQSCSRHTLWSGSFASHPSWTKSTLSCQEDTTSPAKHQMSMSRSSTRSNINHVNRQQTMQPTENFILIRHLWNARLVSYLKSDKILASSDIFCWFRVLDKVSSRVSVVLNATNSEKNQSQIIVNLLYSKYLFWDPFSRQYSSWDWIRPHIWVPPIW